MVPTEASIDVRFTNVGYSVEMPGKRTLPLGKRSMQEVQILSGVTGYVAAGESLAILGPSGSGKTTLLNLLAGRSKFGLSAGSIRFGGAPRTARTKRDIGYVMQDDLFFSRLTVRETLDFTARIRLSSEYSDDEKRKRVDDVLRRLRLEKCADTRIGDQQFDKGVSGGERKRVNIANELLHHPKVLLADECTSGLDSSSAYTVIQLIKKLCDEGRTIICTIHQPSSQMFYLFDKIMLLAAGRVAYFGSPARVSSYFSSIDFPFPETAYNPADYMLELVIDFPRLNNEGATGDAESPQSRILSAWDTYGKCTEMGKEALPPVHNKRDLVVVQLESSESSDDVTQADKSVEFPTDSDEMQGMDAEKDLTWKERKGWRRALYKRYLDTSGQRGKDGLNDKYPTSWWTQVRVLSRRAIRQKRGNLLERAYVMQVVAISLICAFFWFQMDTSEDSIDDRIGALFFFVVFWSFFSIFSALFTFPAERAVLFKDRASGAYRLSAYYFAKTTVETPADAVYPLLFSIFVYYIIGLNPRVSVFLAFCGIMVLQVLAAQSIGLFISAVIKDVKEAQVLGSVWVLMSMLVGGFYINSDNIPSFLRYLSWLSYLKYAYEALVKNDMRGVSFECVPEGQPHTIFSQNGAKCPVTAEQVFEGAQLKSFSVGGNVGILVLWVVVMRLLGYLAMKYLNTNHKPHVAKKSR